MTDNAKQKVILISTGGTIEKTYDEQEGSLANRKSVIEEILKNKLRMPYTDFDIRVIMGKDSLDLDDNDREVICKSIMGAESLNAPIIVLHGTDTMEKTAKHCYQNNPKVSVPVIFTGAMKPIGFENSDAIQNITESQAYARILKPGHYIVFHGRLFLVPNVRKNKQLGTFESIENS